MSDQWYHQAFGQEFGPFSEEDLARMLVSGELTAEDEVRRGSVGPWVTAGSVPRLMERASAVAVETAEVATDIDSFTLVEELPAEEPAEPAPRVAATRSQSVASPAIQSADNDPVWYFQTFGEELGPVTLEVLGEMVQREEIGPSDVIRRGRDGDWVPAGENITLFPELQSVSRAATRASRFEIPSGPATATRAVFDRTATPPPPTRMPPAPRMPAQPQPVIAAAPAWTAPVPVTDVNWYCFVNEQEYGPLGIAELQGMAASGQITPEVYVKYGPAGEWVPALQVPDLFPAGAYAGASPVQTAPVAWETPAVAYAAPAPAAPAPAAGNLADAERSELVHQLLALLKKEGLSNELMGSINTSAPQVGAGWYCNISGNIMGPVTIQALVQMVLQKRIFPDDLIRLGNSGEWFPAKSVPDLFPDTSPLGKAKKSSLDSGPNVMDRIDQMYREAQEAKAKAEAESRANPASQVNTGSAGPAKTNVANEVLRNMSANIARGRTEVKHSSGDGSLADQFKELTASIGGTKAVVALAVVGLLVAGYFFTPNLFGDFVAGGGFKQLMEVNGKIVNAREGTPDPATWAKDSKPLLDTIVKVQKNMKGAKTGSPRKDVAKMAMYLKGMVEQAAKKPAPGEEDEFERNRKLFESATKAAMKKMGIK